MLQRYVEPDPSFRPIRCGLALDQGPSIFWTSENRDEINAEHRVILEGKPAPKMGRPAKPKRKTPAQYQHEFRRTLHRLGLAA